MFTVQGRLQRQCGSPSDYQKSISSLEGSWIGNSGDRLSWSRCSYTCHSVFSDLMLLLWIRHHGSLVDTLLLQPVFLPSLDGIIQTNTHRKWFTNQGSFLLLSPRIFLFFPSALPPFVSSPFPPNSNIHHHTFHNNRDDLHLSSGPSP